VNGLEQRIGPKLVQIIGLRHWSFQEYEENCLKNPEKKLNTIKPQKLAFFTFKT